ncbi:MAG: hypothetical protein AAF657_04585 [Acidobacteriota bacterium]
MKSISIAALLLLVLLSIGCASKSELEAAQQQLANCQEEKVKLEASVISWEERFDSASTRWTDLEASVSDALPKALNEFHEERDRIIELVPDQVQDEVTAYLDDYFSTVMKGFGQLVEDNQEIKTQLRVTHKALEAVGADTKAISASIDQTVSEERSKREEEQAKRERVATYLSELVDQIVEFDHSRISCKDCPQRLKLKDRPREALLAFHAELMSDLADIQRFAGEPPALAPEGDEGL